MANPKVHRTAVVSSKAKIADGVEIGPYCIVGDRVKIGKNTILKSHIVLEHTDIGQNCTVYPFTSIGLPPQDTRYKDEKTKVKIGKNNIIREYITIHRASVDGDKITSVGNNNFLMAYVHLAHDCKIGNNIIMANSSTLAGHVIVEDYAFLGGVVAVHQFSRIGAYSMIGGFSSIAKDVPPYTTAAGNRAKLYGLNAVGLKRNNFSDDTIKSLKKAYKVLFRSKLTQREAINILKDDAEKCPEVKDLIEFIEQNKRGICR